MYRWPTLAWSNSMASSFWDAGAMRWRMRRGVPNVKLSMSSVEMPYTWIWWTGLRLPITEQCQAVQF